MCQSTYPELVRFERCRFVVLGAEVSGRWDVEAVRCVATTGKKSGKACAGMAEGHLSAGLARALVGHRGRGRSKSELSGARGGGVR